MFIWGSMRALDSEQTSTPDKLAHFLERCVEAGCAGVDVADIYNQGQSERLVGKALKIAPELASHLPVIAKSGVVFATGDGPVSAHHYRNDARHLSASLDGSLRRLGVEQVSMFLVHRPDFLMKFDETARALEDSVASGKAARIGVSNFSVSQMTGLQGALSKPLDHHQLELSVLEAGALKDGRLDFAASTGQTVTAWSPLGGGRLFDPGDDQARRVRDVLAKLAGSDDADRIAGAALAWVMRHPAAPIPILGGADINRIERQCAAISAVEMTPESWYAVLEASRGQRVP